MAQATLNGVMQLIVMRAKLASLRWSRSPCMTWVVAPEGARAKVEEAVYRWETR